MTWHSLVLAGLIGLGAGELAQESDTVRAIEVEGAQVILIHDLLVPAEQPGVLRELAAKLGDFVMAGAPLGSIDVRGLKLEERARKLELQVARLRGDNDIDYRYAEKSFEVAQARLQRAENAYEQFKRSVTLTEIDELGLTAKRAELQMEQSLLDQEAAQIDVRLKSQQAQIAALRIEQSSIQVERNGFVVELLREPGEWVREGDPVMRVVSLDELFVDGWVMATSDDSKLLGRQVSFVATEPAVEPAARFEGAIVFVSPLIDPVNGQIKVRAKIDNPDQLLRPGTLGIMTIQ